MAFGIALGGVDEGGVPAPAIGAGHTDAALQQIHRGVIAHAAAGADIIRLAIAPTRTGIHQHDFER